MTAMEVKDDDDRGMSVGCLATTLAFLGAGLAMVRLWKHLSVTFGWVSLVLGGLAVGMALVRLVTTPLEEIGGVWSGVWALILGASCVVGVAYPWVPAVALGLWLLAVGVIGLIF